MLAHIIKASRIQRSLFAVGTVCLTMAFSRGFDWLILVLAGNAALLYAVGGLVNAKRDGDYELGDIMPAIAAFMAVPLLTSLYHPVIAVSTALWLLFGYVYNFISRKVVLLDSVVLGFTHVIIPGISAALILDIALSAYLPILLSVAASYAGVVSIKNVKQKVEDARRGYATLANSCRYGILYTMALYSAAVLLMIYTMRGMLKTGLLFPVLIAISCLPLYLRMRRGDHFLPVELMKVTWFLYIFALVFTVSDNFFVVFVAFALFAVHVYFIRSHIYRTLCINFVRITAGVAYGKG
jgi:hypothetical protein